MAKQMNKNSKYFTGILFCVWLMLCCRCRLNLASNIQYEYNNNTNAEEKRRKPYQQQQHQNRSTEAMQIKWKVFCIFSASCHLVDARNKPEKKNVLPKSHILLWCGTMWIFHSFMSSSYFCVARRDGIKMSASQNGMQQKPKHLMEFLNYYLLHREFIAKQIDNKQ